MNPEGRREQRTVKREKWPEEGDNLRSRAKGERGATEEIEEPQKQRWESQLGPGPRSRGRREWECGSKSRASAPGHCHLTCPQAPRAEALAADFRKGRVEEQLRTKGQGQGELEKHGGEL